MLHYETVEQPTLELLRKLQTNDLFCNLRLVGGTSLALQIGHRISVDIDLFGELKEDTIDINAALKEIGSFSQLKNSKNIHIYLINGVKVDIVNYQYPWLDAIVTENDFKLAGKKDIAAMKIAAITGRGSKKDFIDIYFLLKDLTLCEILELYQKKYAEESLFMALKSLIYFDDAEKEEMPVMLLPITWNEVKNAIQNNYNNYLKNNLYL